MPTYRNNRKSVITLLTSTPGAFGRTILPGETFVASPDEVPASWLKTHSSPNPNLPGFVPEADHLDGGKAIVELLSQDG